jgi:iron complex outermembrane receptor protein
MESRLNTRYLLPVRASVAGSVFQDRGEAAGGYALGRWERLDETDGSATVFQAFFDRMSRDIAVTGDSRNTVDLEFQNSRPWRQRHRVLWGAGFRVSDNTGVATAYSRIDPPRRVDPLATAFVQDEIALWDGQGTLSLGTKLEHNNYTGVEVQPGARFAWTPSRSHTAWAAVSRAVSTPSRADHDVTAWAQNQQDPMSGLPIHVVFGFNRDLPTEKLTAVEGGYRWQCRRDFTLDVAVFHNWYRDLASSQRLTPLLRLDGGRPLVEQPVRLIPGAEGAVRGAETSLMWKPLNWWKVSGSYSFLLESLRLRSPAEAVTIMGAGVNPRHQGQLRSYLDLPGGLELDAATYARSSLANGVPRSHRIDLRLGWRRGSFEASAGGQNLLDSRRLEFISEEPWAFPTEIGRSFYVGITLRF